MMQRFKAALLLRRNNLRIHSLCFLNQYHTRALCSLLDTTITDELDNQVLVEGKAWSRIAILNRPLVLNCLSTAMPHNTVELENVEPLKDSENKAGKRKCQSDQVGVQSMEMLKVRAALEERLKQEGILSSRASKSD